MSQSRFHGGHGCESAGAAPSMFDRRSINLTAIDLFLRSKDREEVENIAERMCRRAEHKQGTKSFNLSNMKKDEGMQQLLDEINGHDTEEPVAVTKKVPREADDKSAAEDDGSPVFSGLSAGHSGPAGVIIENLDDAEALITTSESDPYGFNEQRASQAKECLDKANAECEKLRDRAQRNDLLDRHRNMGLRLQKIEERKGEIVQKKVEELFNKANIAMKLFPDCPKPEEIKEVEDLLEEARLELKELFANNYDTLRAGLCCRHRKLNEELQKKINSSETKSEGELLMEEYGDFEKNYSLKSGFLEDRFKKCDQSDLPKFRDVTEDLKGFYENSLRTAEPLRDKMIGKQGYDNECHDLTVLIDKMRKLINTLEEIVNRVKQDNR